MYPISTRQPQLSIETMGFILARDFGSGLQAEEGKLRSIADLAYDLLNKIGKSEKLRKLGQLGKNGEAEFDSNVRLVGIVMEILRRYSYTDAEMMASLEKKYLQIAPGIAGMQA